MKRNLLIATICACLSVVALSTVYAEGRDLIDRVVAVVGGEVIMLSEVRMVSEQNPDAPLDKILDSLVNEKIIEVEARKRGVEITDKEVDYAIDRHIEEMGVSREEFDALLAKEGISFDDYRAKVRVDLLKVKYVRSAIEGDVEISDDEALNYYRRHPDQFVAHGEVHIARIFLPFPMDANEDDKQKARTLAEELRKRAQAGENFAELAKKYSKSADAAGGGDLGWVNPGDLAEAFATVIEKLEIGKVSDVIEMESGCYLLVVIEKKESGTLAFEDVKEKVRQYLYSVKIAEQLDKLISDAKLEIPIEILL